MCAYEVQSLYCPSGRFVFTACTVCIPHRNTQYIKHTLGHTHSILYGAIMTVPASPPILTCTCTHTDSSRSLLTLSTRQFVQGCCGRRDKAPAKASSSPFLILICAQCREEWTEAPISVIRYYESKACLCSSCLKDWGYARQMILEAPCVMLMSLC